MSELEQPRHGECASDRILHVWIKGFFGEYPRHKGCEHWRPSARVLRVWVKGMAGKWGNTPDAKNATTWSRSSRLGSGGWRERWVVVGRVVGHPRHKERDTGVTCSCLGYGTRPRHEKRDPVVAYFMSGSLWVVERVSGVWKTTQTRRTRPCGHVLCVWVFLCPSLHYLPPRHEKRVHVVTFFGSGEFSTPQT